jgi:hypothetical protein
MWCARTPISSAASQSEETPELRSVRTPAASVFPAPHARRPHRSRRILMAPSAAEREGHSRAGHRCSSSARCCCSRRRGTWVRAKGASPGSRRNRQEDRRSPWRRPWPTCRWRCLPLRVRVRTPRHRRTRTRARTRCTRRTPRTPARSHRSSRHSRPSERPFCLPHPRWRPSAARVTIRGSWCAS